MRDDATFCPRCTERIDYTLGFPKGEDAHLRKPYGLVKSCCGTAERQPHAATCPVRVKQERRAR